MSNRNFWVSFQSLLVDPDEADPPGKAIAHRLRQRLTEQQIECGAVENWRDCGHSVDCTIDGRGIYWFLARVEHLDMWVACCTADRGLLAGFLRRVGGHEQLAKLANAMHLGLCTDEDFSEIRWYPDGWRGLEGERWSATPTDS